jgi:hypothetical protein
VQRDDLLDDEEPDPHPADPLRLHIACPKKAREQSRLRVGWDADALVGDHHAGGCRLQRQLDAHLAAAGAIFDGVLDAILQHLLQP